MEPGAEVGSGVPPGDQARALVQRVAHVSRHLVELGGADERPHVGLVVKAGAKPHRVHTLSQPPGEFVGDGRVDEDPLDRDAQLTGVGKAADERALHRPVEIGVAADDHRVFAAQFERGADEPFARLPGDDGAGLAAAGEGDAVDRVEEGGAELASFAGDDLKEICWQSRLFKQRGDKEGGEGCLLVGLEQGRVAHQERRDGVGDGERERVVPGRDEADEAERQVVDARPGEEGQGALARFGAQMTPGGAGRVAAADGRIEHLLEGVAARFAAFELDEVEQLFLAIEDEVVQAHEDAPPLGDRGLAP